jgi:signal transduction histidine kinase
MASSGSNKARSEQRYLAWLAVALTVVIFAITWFSIRESRSASYELLGEQGRAFTEALAQASDNAITSETFYDNLVRARYSDLIVTLTNWGMERITEQQWVSFALSHDLKGVYVYDTAADLVAGVTVRGERTSPPEYVEAEVDSLLAEPESRFVLFLDEGEIPGQVVHYYLELSSRMDQVVILVADALFFNEALNETGIGHLAQEMAREPGVDYIVYQTTEGVIFSSRRVDDLSRINDDPFLTGALDADSIVERVYKSQDQDLLELVRPFSTETYPFGLFRVGLSLEGYYAVSRGFDQQMIILSGVLLILLMVALAYLRGRRKRLEMMVEYERQAQRRERLSEMGNLAAGVAHEIRNPLNTISIAAQRLAREFTPDSDREQYTAFTQQIRSETTRLNEIITRFLALAREEKKQRVAVDLADLLEEVGDLLKLEGDKIGLQVTVRSEPGLRIEADADRLKEAFLNLFNNSKEALDGKPGTFEIAARRRGKQIEIGVTDNGPGIPAELHEKVFAPYHTSKEAGTGLGLPTVQRIVTDFGGEVTIDADYSPGARFLMMIPAGVR